MNALRKETWERYGVMAQAVMATACKDALPGSSAPAEMREDARAFLHSEKADIWAKGARLDLRRIRKLMAEKEREAKEARSNERN